MYFSVATLKSGSNKVLLSLEKKGAKKAVPSALLASLATFLYDASHLRQPFGLRPNSHASSLGYSIVTLLVASLLGC